MIHKIFSPFYYKSKVTDHEKIKTSLIDHIQTQHTKNPNNQPESWSCKVHTTQSKFDLKLFSIKEFYQKDVIKFIDDLKVPASIEVSISDIWFNAYKKGQWQESHHHYGKQSVYFSAVHFLKYDKELHPPLIFNNMNRLLFTPCNIGRSTSLDYWDLDKVVDVEEGDVIIFPSFIEHQVNVQESDELRSTISFNIELKYNESNS
jgi:uncharacterized protein (TIGR02466 family)